MNWVKARIGWWQESLPGRTLTRFGKRRGNVLAGGIAYYALFSIFPALAVGFTVFGYIVGGSVQLQQDLVDYVNDAFGGAQIVSMEPPGPDNAAIISISSLTSTAALSITAIVGLLLLLWAGLGWLSAMSAGIQVMFDIAAAGNMVKKKSFDLVMLIVFGIALLISVAGSIIVASASEWAADAIGLGSSAWASWSTTFVTLLVILAVDTAIFLLLFKIGARIPLPVSELWFAALVGGIGMGLLKYFAQFVFNMASGNEFLKTFAVVIGLLLWMNFAGRVVLLAASWAAEQALDHGLLIATVRREQDNAAADEQDRVATGAKAAAAVVAMDAATASTANGSHPSFGQRSADRTTLAAGVVLGATVVAGWHAVTSALRSLASRQT